LCVRFVDGLSATLEAELLRVESPSAEVKGHSPAQRKLVPGKRHVRIQNIEPVGNYAVRLIFDDGHATGIYAWPYLRELAEDHDRMWNAYIKALAAAGLTRDP
jgi:DUF971 family protein